jgi:nitrite reductase (NADH) small subunit
MSTMQIAQWTAVCTVQDIPMLGSRVIERMGKPPIALFRTSNDDVFAVLDQCPHKKGPLSQGIVHGQHVTCPLHGWNIHLGSGEAQAPDVGCAARFTVHIEDNKVHLLASEVEA